MRRGTKIALWVIGVPLGVVIALAVKTAVDPEARQRIAGRSACERMIELHSKNRKTAEIGRVRPVREGDLLIFAWSPDTLQLQNSFGAMLGQYAICSYNTKTAHIDEFEVF